MSKLRTEEDILHSMWEHKINCEQAFHSDCDEFIQLKKELATMRRHPDELRNQ
jgi:hypothetical protein